jgi:hypothetical protein
MTRRWIGFQNRLRPESSNCATTRDGLFPASANSTVSLKSTFLKGPQSASRLVPADLDTTGATRAGDLGDTEDPF